MFQNPYASLIPQQNQYYNPQMNNQQIYPQIQTQNLIRVNGIEGAKAYQMSANSIVSLFDANDDIMYIKSTDGAGFPSIRTFSFTEVKEQNKPIQQVDYISREEFEERISRWEFLEYAIYNENYYGTPRDKILINFKCFH